MMLTPHQHQALHIELHHALDQLLACYIAENWKGTIGQRASIHNQILDLMQWAHQKTMKPSPMPENWDAHDSRSPADFEEQRGVIVLALARLAVSHPEYEVEILNVVRFYDGEGLPLYEGFKVTGAPFWKSLRRVRESSSDGVKYSGE
jgi:hypothetical protein